jgi:HPt (histidine-containing phosphotransfer) domain-containing protein
MAPIDQRVIGELRALETRGSPGFLGRLINVFLQESGVQMARLRAAFDNHDAPRFERAAHLLQGSSGHLGAERMSGLCRLLQTLARAADWGRAAELLPELEEEFRDVRIVLSDLRPSK